jgi:phosphonate transport system permease protein
VIPSVYVLLSLIAIWWSLSGLIVTPERLVRGFQQAGMITYQMFVQPDWSYFWKEGGVVEGMRQSIQIAALGTVIAAILAIPFGMLAANNLSRFFLMPVLGKQLLNLIRAFPELLLAIAFIKGIGPGAFAGVLAVGIHSVGMMGKLYAERIETVERGALESLTAAGASSLEVFVYGILPDVLPDFLSFTLYRFDLNIRSATILGIVGAGGIGEKLVFQQMASNWHTIGVIVMSIMVTIIIVDVISTKLRARLT